MYVRLGWLSDGSLRSVPVAHLDGGSRVFRFLSIENEINRNDSRSEIREGESHSGVESEENRHGTECRHRGGLEGSRCSRSRARGSSDHRSDDPLGRRPSRSSSHTDRSLARSDSTRLDSTRLDSTRASSEHRDRHPAFRIGKLRVNL